MHLFKTAKAALKAAPKATTSQKVQQAINHPFKTVADALAFFDPSFGPKFHKWSGFDIPIHRQLFASLLKKALNDKRFDKLTIITAIAASIVIPPAGELKKVGLHLVKRFLCRVVHNHLLPGLKHNVPFSKYIYIVVNVKIIYWSPFFI